MQIQSSLRDFELLKKIGEGAFGQVYQVSRKKDGIIYAMKKIKIGSMKSKQKQLTLNEVRILASLNNEYIIKFKDCFYDQAAGNMYIVMQYAAQGDLLKLVNKNIKDKIHIPQNQLWKALLHLSKGLKSLHNKKIIHRDIKSANVFITETGIYKIGDLNISKVLKNKLAYTQTGTPHYASPQIWQDQPYDMASDMWSLGCVIYEMAALEPPFKANDLKSLYTKIKLGTYKALSSYYSSDLSRIISYLLKLRPKQRLTSDEIVQHPLVRKNCGMEINDDLDDNQNDPLLRTIKYNPYNLRQLNKNLPKSDYINNESSKEKKRRRNSIDLIRNNRVLSSYDHHKQYGLSPSESIKCIDIKNKPSNTNVIQKYDRLYLPPKPIRKSQNQNKYNVKRFQRIAQQIVSGRQTRYNSVNK